MNSRTRSLPQPVVRRLIKYLMHLEALKEKDVAWVASHELANALGLTSSTVRQDLSHLDFSGISKKGYEIGKLESALQSELGAEQTMNVVIVGAGNLGRALALHGALERYGFIIRAVLDSAPALAGKKIGSLKIQSMDGLSKAVQGERIDIGMIAVPQEAAQEVADRLVEAGVTGILNLTPGHVHVPETVTVVEARILASLQELSYLIQAGKASSDGSEGSVA